MVLLDREAASLPNGIDRNKAEIASMPAQIASFAEVISSMRSMHGTYHD
jgi:hypothetical protein